MPSISRSRLKTPGHGTVRIQQYRLGAFGWKGTNVTKYSVPKMAKPVQQQSGDQQTKQLAPNGKPNPLSIYRKRGAQNNGTDLTCDTDPTLNSILDVRIGEEVSNETTCCNSTENSVEGISKPFKNKYNYQIHKATTVIDKKYNSSTKQYLQRRCKTFESRQYIGKKEDNNLKFRNNEYYSYSTTTCPIDSENPDSTCVQVTYKITNPKFSTNSAVSSSTRLERLKLEATMKHNKNQYDNYGQSYRNVDKIGAANCNINRRKFRLNRNKETYCQ